MPPLNALPGNLRNWARRIKRDGVTLWFACRHPATPKLTKILCAFVVAYALSPIDLVPDFIPVLGYLDEIVLLPALIWLAVRLMPRDVLAVCRSQAERWIAERKARPTSYWGIALVLCVWILLACSLWMAFR
ncbi:YkvA family protein [Cupriavidus sp. AU9028]|uniref:YkvA family protein n=1 Tax=Cupriavidus sp. AU9028 TaxID=2871157 RepID=UPI001C973A8F|nr:YkvA family protein [Cupriavidus sp. AU9028]MBY4898505.1 DUF1232 domain-containing protein [Cupriavidus sp. AU9028]